MCIRDSPNRNQPALQLTGAPNPGRVRDGLPLGPPGDSSPTKGTAVELRGALNFRGLLMTRALGRLRLEKEEPAKGGSGGLPPAHSLSSSVLVENGWWLSSCLVVRPSASAQGAATQALQRRHSGALCRAKSIHGELAGVGMCMWLAAAAWLAG